jgi:hypothetical protein
MPRDPSPHVSFVIPVRNDAARLQRCLTSIAANDYPADAVEVIVVDHGSSDGSDILAHQAGARVIVCDAPRVAALRNRGAALASAPILAFVDADHELDPQWLRAVTHVFSEQGVAAAGAMYLPPPHGTWVQRTYAALRGPTAGHGDVAWLGSGNLAVRRHIFNRIGGFDTTLTTCEDVDFCARLRAHGHRLVGDESLRSVHAGDPASLRAVFFGEIWRGRDNLRVSLRSGLSPRDWPSVMVPLIDVACLAAIPISLAWFTPPAFTIAASAGAVIVGFALLRSLRMLVRAKPDARPRPDHALAVALVYDVARALALVTRTTHQVRAARV